MTCRDSDEERHGSSPWIDVPDALLAEKRGTTTLSQEITGVLSGLRSHLRSTGKGFRDGSVMCFCIQRPHCRIEGINHRLVTNLGASARLHSVASGTIRRSQTRDSELCGPLGRERQEQRAIQCARGTADSAEQLHAHLLQQQLGRVASGMINTGSSFESTRHVGAVIAVTDGGIKLVEHLCIGVERYPGIAEPALQCS